ncbi:hypothetical protein CYMTET_17225 [Cymbomonas tetramitiformis]|uniref:Uncharacterized protein n=1 Tax=Cymbomonas tetramitiformis TaxID=36881 RepID=A0AAE0GAQ1_9CHLO|nr:hypothetical protein CYMTET_17225 [Cymbomonas tetramitiformis]
METLETYDKCPEIYISEIQNTKDTESIAFVSDEDCTVLSDEEDDDLADILGVASGVSDPSSTRVLNASRRKIIETREAIKPFLTHMKSSLLRTSCT